MLQPARRGAIHLDSARFGSARFGSAPPSDSDPFQLVQRSSRDSARFIAHVSRMREMGVSSFFFPSLFLFSRRDGPRAVEVERDNGIRLIAQRNAVSVAGG